MTRTPLSRSKGQRSRSSGRFAHRRVGASGGCSGGRENVLAVGNCCYVAVCLAAQGASAPTGESGGAIPWRPLAYSLLDTATLSTERYDAIQSSYTERIVYRGGHSAANLLDLNDSVSTKAARHLTKSDSESRRGRPGEVVCTLHRQRVSVRCSL